jgi:hypothetical protein
MRNACLIITETLASFADLCAIIITATSSLVLPGNELRIHL